MNEEVIKKLRQLTHNETGSLTALVRDFKALYPQEVNAIFALKDFFFNEDVADADKISAKTILDLLNQVQ